MDNIGKAINSGTQSPDMLISIFILQQKLLYVSENSAFTANIGENSWRLWVLIVTT
jgi:hypothetical protein